MGGQSRSAYTFELRQILCPSCGAPIDVPPEGGVYRCRFCSAQSQIAARGQLPAFAPPPAARISEAERFQRLRAQTGQALLPPPSIDSLFADGGEIPAWRQQDVLVAWQSARKRTAEGALDAADELVYLNVVLGNQFMASKDWTRHRAMLESSFEAFFLPRHRSSVASDLCCGACRQRDLAGAQKWLGFCDPASDDLFADSAYRLARTAVAFYRDDYQDAIAALGQSPEQIPVHDSYEATIAVHRAHAWEFLGRMDLAVSQLTRELLARERSRKTVEDVTRNGGLCPKSYPAALASMEQELDRRRVSASRGPLFGGLACLLLAFVTLPLGGVAAYASDDPEARLVFLVLAGVFGLVFAVVGAVLMLSARQVRMGTG